MALLFTCSFLKTENQNSNSLDHAWLDYSASAAGNSLGSNYSRLLIYADTALICLGKTVWKGNSLVLDKPIVQAAANSHD
jgi:hypothetical protein